MKTNTDLFSLVGKIVVNSVEWKQLGIFLFSCLSFFSFLLLLFKCSCFDTVNSGSGNITGFWWNSLRLVENITTSELLCFVPSKTLLIHAAKFTATCNDRIVLFLLLKPKHMRKICRIEFYLVICANFHRFMLIYTV